ncbi:tetratricopeptide repeat-containing protein [Pontiella sulfatireligans]|uniref:tetratricopeptide repeat-containing protein n=1 Tax=Pontiella sulfatireligans TaxID=2750658 RepID=UPI00109CA3CE|nr:tetratricopeptide repeat-containing protein [Pontiella sulfatireligans]
MEIVHPDSTDHYSYKLLYKILTNTRGAFSAVESARLAVENREFQEAINLLMPGVDDLDANAIVTLALALESIGFDKDAEDVIERWNTTHARSALDPVGVLAGRLKRRWLVGRQQKDFDRALELYSDGFKQAEEKKNHDQAYYHAINVAYLLLVSPDEDVEGALTVEYMVERALYHVEVAQENQWTYATIGEAFLIQGKLEESLEAYGKAKALANTLRECDSMHMQAVAVSSHVFGDKVSKQIDEAFGYVSESVS